MKRNHFSFKHYILPNSVWFCCAVSLVLKAQGLTNDTVDGISVMSRIPLALAENSDVWAVVDVDLNMNLCSFAIVFCLGVDGWGVLIKLESFGTSYAFDWFGYLIGVLSDRPLVDIEYVYLNGRSDSRDSILSGFLFEGIRSFVKAWPDEVCFTHRASGVPSSHRVLFCDQSDGVTLESFQGDGIVSVRERINDRTKVFQDDLSETGGIEGRKGSIHRAKNYSSWAVRHRRILISHAWMRISW